MCRPARQSKKFSCIKQQDLCVAWFRQQFPQACKKALQLVALASSFPLCITFGLHHRSHRWCGAPGTMLQSPRTCSSVGVLSAPSLATHSLQTLRHLHLQTGLFWRCEQGSCPSTYIPLVQSHPNTTHPAPTWPIFCPLQVLA